MKFRDVGLCLVGGSIMYVSMAACAGSRGGATAGGGIALHEGTGGGRGGSGGSVLGTGGAPGTGGIAPDSGLGDALSDPVPSANAEPAAGSRLRPRYRLGDDGAKEFLAGSWYDSQRNEDCSFMLAADGKSRCLPPGTEFRYYADASCTQAMVLLQGACSPPRYGTTNSDAACGLDPSSLHVYAIGAAASPPMIYGKSGASCFAIGPTTSDYQYFIVGEEIPASAFVAATVTHD